MLKIIQCIPANRNEEANRKRNNNNRIYEEYVSTLNDLLDKWTSLRLVDGEQKRKSSDQEFKEFCQNAWQDLNYCWDSNCGI